MKVFILPIGGEARQKSQPFRYPKHNRDFGVEQDFFEFLERHPEHVTPDPGRADWHYLPVYWTRWHLRHDFGRKGLDELQRLVDGAMLNDERTFTICQYDDGPLANLGRTRLFLSSRQGSEGIDIPLLSSPHRRPLFPVPKRYLASFVGRLDTHQIRRDMAAVLKDRADVSIFDRSRGSRFFVRTTVASRIALAPRGYGGSSFRFFEAMQLAIVPFLIGDPDTRPFKRFIHWDDLSLYARSADEIGALLDARGKDELEKMGARCREFYLEHMAYQRWCPYVLRELEDQR